LHGNPFTRGALADRSATQKSCKGSGSAAFTAPRKAAAQSTTRSILMSGPALTEVFAIAATAAPSSVLILKTSTTTSVLMEQQVYGTVANRAKRTMCCA
jgi:hypothetical protein